MNITAQPTHGPCAEIQVPNAVSPIPKRTVVVTAAARPRIEPPKSAMPVIASPVNVANTATVTLPTAHRPIENAAIVTTPVRTARRAAENRADSDASRLDSHRPTVIRTLGAST